MKSRRPLQTAATTYCVPYFSNQLGYELQRNRSYKNKPRMITAVIICLLIAVCVLSSFYIVEYIFYDVYKQKSFKVIPAFENAIKAVSPMYSLINAIRYSLS